ncbi:MAG: mannosyltransferase, partial [Actinobacteria bacterium]|nr:mannosyltransferase [Actinomycetota bacterium]
MKTRSLLVVLAIAASVLSFAKFSHCQSHQWATPDQYVHACYSDIPALFGERGLDKGTWAFSSGDKSVEYPVITGAIMWLSAKITPQSEFRASTYFNINAMYIAILFVLCTLLMYRITPQFAYLSVLSPAVIASLYINWDLWAIISMIGAIYLFDKHEYKWSAAALGLSVATKFMPVFLLIPIALILWRRRELQLAAQYIAITATTWLVFNLPVILTTPQGWLRFYELNLSRDSDWGSLWYALTKFGANVGALNYLAVVVTLVLILGLTIFYSEICKTRSPLHNLFLLIFLTMAAFTTINKVYSPQYVLWLTPFAVLALNDKKERSAFWIWQ